MPMIWMGQEFGAASEKSLDPRPLDWSLLQNKDNADLRAHVRGARSASAKHARASRRRLRDLSADPERRVFAFKRWNEEGNVLVVLVNLRHEPAGEVAIEGHSLDDGPWHEHVFNYDCDVVGGVLQGRPRAQRRQDLHQTLHRLLDDPPGTHRGHPVLRGKANAETFVRSTLKA